MSKPAFSHWCPRDAGGKFAPGAGGKFAPGAGGKFAPGAGGKFVPGAGGKFVPGASAPVKCHRAAYEDKLPLNLI